MAQANTVEQAQRLAAVRQDLAARGLYGFVVPRADEHQGEYVPPHAERLAWLTGFTGSAGLAIVTADRAAVFVDGRYTLQVTVEVDGDLYEHRHLSDTPPAEWLAQAASAARQPDGGPVRIGFDPWLHTPDGIARLRDACAKVGAEVVAIDGENPIDRAWQDRPAAPSSPVMRHPLEFAGESAEAKRQRIALSLRDDGLEAAVLTAPESLAWLLNLRGSDVPFTPLVLGFAILRADASLTLFLDPAKEVDGLRDYLGQAVTVLPPAALAGALAELSGKRVRLDQASCAVWIAERLTAAGATVALGADPCALPRACKNATELSGIKAAHQRDGVALCRFLAWLDAEAGSGTITELVAADHLEALRREGAYFRDLSFPSIVGSGPHGAIVHYRADADSDRRLGQGELFLVDSGAQYLDGTTDVTRTLAIGTPTAEMIRRYTQVLKGHVALSQARFPQGTTGSQLDVLARQYLWADGVDYDHGTGHGVGAYLSVHEGPQRISKVPSTIALKAGMVLSNEPGYYKPGAFGIRIENLIAVTAMEPPPSGAERPMMFFETLTLAPYDRRLIDPSLLRADERDWINAYHRRVHQQIVPALAGRDALWLDWACAPL